MKKLKLLMLSAISVVALAGCGNADNARALDLEKEEDVQIATTKTKELIRQTFSLATGFTFTGEVKSANLNVNADALVQVDEKQEAATAKIGFNDLAGKVQFAIGDMTSTTVTPGAKWTASGWAGKFDVAADLPAGLLSQEAIKEEKEITWSGLDFEAWLNEQTIYANLSGNGVRSTLTNVTTKVDEIVGIVAKAIGEEKEEVIADLCQIIQENLGIPVTSLDFNSILDAIIGTGRKFKVESGISVATIPAGFDIETITAYVDQYLPIVITTLKSMDMLNLLTVTTWDSGKFGIEFKVNKDALIKILTLLLSSSEYASLLPIIKAAITEFDVTISLTTDKTVKLASVSLSETIKANVDLVEIGLIGTDEGFSKLAIDLSSAGGVEFTVAAGADTALPSDASDYKLLGSVD